MDVETLREKVAAAAAKAEKCKGTIARHEAQLEKRIDKARALGCPIATGDATELKEYWLHHNQSEFTNEQVWAIIDANCKFGDIRGAQSKLRDAELVLQNWERKLADAIEVERVIEENCPAVIKEFLEQWKVSCTEYYQNKFDKWPEFVEALHKAEMIARVECLQGVAEGGAAQFVADNDLDGVLWKRSWHQPEVAEDVKAAKLEALTEAYTKRWKMYCERESESLLRDVYPHSLMDAYLGSCGLDWKGIQESRRDYGGELLLKMVEQGGREDAFAYLEKALEAEKKAKIIDLVNRIEKVVGRIVDAENLHIGYKGDLEGVIFGEQGKAKINTIGAGGYNIQCFHFRTLIHEIKDKDLQSVLAEAAERSVHNITIKKKDERTMDM